MLERARQRREALKTRLKEASSVTGRKRNVEAADNNENICVDCGDDTADEGRCAAQGKLKVDEVFAVNVLVLQTWLLIKNAFRRCKCSLPYNM